MFYKEDQHGQILEEGITEAGSISSFIAAGTSYSAHDVQTVPFYIYYSMFGYQRVGDLIWAAGDSRTRGFMLGGTAGRTTLNGEGLQHADGHSHVLFPVVPNCRAYDPTFGYELAVIIQDGLRRMLVDQEDVFYYLTLMNENYRHPEMPEGAREGILRGMYLLWETGADGGPRVQLLGSGTILREAMAAAELLEADWGVAADVWSVTSFTELRRDGIEVERWNMLHPLEEQRRAYVTESLAKRGGPVIASTDYVRSFADQIRQWVPGGYRVLGTDGFGRSDTREALRALLRGRPPLRRGGGAQGARRPRRARAQAGAGGDRALRARRRGADADQGMSATNIVSVEVPDIGDFDDVPVIEILVSAGDTVQTDDPLLTLESDKATMDVPAPFPGTITEVSVKVGDRVVAGQAAAEDGAGRGILVAGHVARRPRRRLPTARPARPPRPMRYRQRSMPSRHRRRPSRPRFLSRRRPPRMARSTPARRSGASRASAESICTRSRAAAARGGSRAATSSRSLPRGRLRLRRPARGWGWIWPPGRR